MIDITGMRFVVTRVENPRAEPVTSTDYFVTGHVHREPPVMSIRPVGGRPPTTDQSRFVRPFVAVPVPQTDVRILALAVLTGDATAEAPFVDAYMEVNGTDVDAEVLKEERRKALRWVMESVVAAINTDGAGYGGVMVREMVIEAINTLGPGYVENGE